MTIAQPRNRTTREQRGLQLYTERRREIKHLGGDLYLVPGCDGGSYEVDYRLEACECPDFEYYCRPRSLNCKHIFAVGILRAKQEVRRRWAACFNCRQSVRRRDLIEVLEEDHLTWFVGDLLCGECADNSGVLR